MYSCQSYILKKENNIKPLSHKKIERSLVKVNEKLFASKFELDNFTYQEFLNSLLQKGDSLSFEKSKIESHHWDKFVYYGMPMINDSYSNHPAYENFPVVNVSHQGAQLFCQWMTEFYHQFPKRKYQKVIFRLPTEEEWKVAARSGKDYGDYTWIGNIRDRNGNFKAKFKYIPQTLLKADSEMLVLASKPHPKIYFNSKHPDPVKSYSPNDLGIYNMCGNVAEMLLKEGRTKGGSWNSSGYYLGIESEDEFEGFKEGSPMIGFRYFMEVIEE